MTLRLLLPAQRLLLLQLLNLDDRRLLSLRLLLLARSLLNLRLFSYFVAVGFAAVSDLVHWGCPSAACHSSIAQSMVVR